MSIITEEYQENVIDDIKNYNGLSHPVKTGILSRALIRKLNVNKLHPNPLDEFSIEDIGPNYEIVSNYESTFRHRLNLGMNPIEEPLIVEKMSTGGYMLLNGHHRWFAAKRVSEIKKVPVEIVNVTSETDVLRKLNNSDKKMCVSFDFDEVILSDGSAYPVDKTIGFPFNLVYKCGIKKNAGVLINQLRDMGFDVWIYTGNYYSHQYINGLLKLHNAGVDGIVNGLRNGKHRSSLREAFSNKYEQSLHIDNEGITCVNTKTHEYDIYDIEVSKGDWAAKVYSKVKQIEAVN